MHRSTLHMIQIMKYHYLLGHLILRVCVYVTAWGSLNVLLVSALLWIRYVDIVSLLIMGESLVYCC